MEKINMPISCCVKNCKSKWKAGCGISFFRFPLKDEQRLQEWISVVGRTETWRATATSKICSLHFSSTNIISDFGYQNNQLKPTAVPSLPEYIDMNNENMPNTMEKRQKMEESKHTGHSANVVLVESDRVHVSDTSAQQSTRANATKVVSSKRVADEYTSDCTVKKQKNTIIPEQCFHIFQMEASSDETSTTEDSSPEEVKALHGKIKKLSRKVKTLKQTIRRRDQKIKNMTELFKTLRKANLIDKDSLMTLKNQFEGSDFAIFANQLKNKNRKSCGRRYSDELKQFALSLHYYSPKAYVFCRSAQTFLFTSTCVF